MSIREYAFFAVLAVALVVPILFTPPSEGLRHWLSESRSSTPEQKATWDRKFRIRGISGILISFALLLLAMWLCDCGPIF